MEKQEKLWERFLQSEMTKTIAIVIATISVTQFFLNPTTELNRRVDSLESDVTTQQKLSAQLQNLKDNDLHEIHLSIERLESNQNEMLQAQVKLEAIINERVPKK